MASYVGFISFLGGFVGLLVLLIDIRNNDYSWVTLLLGISVPTSFYFAIDEWIKKSMNSHI